MALPVRALAADLGLAAPITDDCLAVEAAIRSLAPELILGTQMDRHIAKRLGIPCAAISAPVHVHNFPARYSPQMGIEGANVIFDTWVHPLVMGLEEHLLHKFREDVEFHDGALPSHHGAGHGQPVQRDTASRPGLAGDPRAATEAGSIPGEAAPADGAPAEGAGVIWLEAAERELKKVPFFVRGKARRNTEILACKRGIGEIGVDTLCEAKAHHAR